MIVKSNTYCRRQSTKDSETIRRLSCPVFVSNTGENVLQLMIYERISIFKRVISVWLPADSLQQIFCNLSCGILFSIEYTKRPWNVVLFCVCLYILFVLGRRSGSNKFRNFVCGYKPASFTQLARTLVNMNY